MSHLLLNADTAVLAPAGGQHWGAPGPELCDAVGWFPYDKFPASHSQAGNIKIALRIAPCCFLKGEVSVNISQVRCKFPSWSRAHQHPVSHLFWDFLRKRQLHLQCRSDGLSEGKREKAVGHSGLIPHSSFALGFPWLRLSAKFQWTRIKLYLRMSTCH